MSWPGGCESLFHISLSGEETAVPPLDAAQQEASSLWVYRQGCRLS